MIEEPLWLTFLKSNPEAFSDFIEWITAAEQNIISDIRVYIRKDDFNRVKLCEGELDALDKLRNLSTMATKEKDDFSEFKRLAGSNTTKDQQRVK